ncbi:MAG: MarR family transcriptional regulator [Patescibacteria group bacterium]|nr:MarR family transcriptional regulator [Patescibacteria group bacterium]
MKAPRIASSATIPLFTDVGALIKGRLQQALPLPFSQCQTLWFIARQGRPNMQDVAKHFKITAPSATFLADELVRSGLVVREASTKDRRKVEVALTPKGKRECKVLMRKRTQVLSSIFDSLNNADRAELNRILKKILLAV